MSEVNGRTNGGAYGRASEGTYKRVNEVSNRRTDGRTSSKTSRMRRGRSFCRIVRNTIAFLTIAVLLIASFIYLESGHNILSIIEANTGRGSLKGEIDNPRSRKVNVLEGDNTDGGITDGVITNGNITKADLSDVAPSRVNLSELDLSSGANKSSHVNSSKLDLSNEIMLVNSENMIDEDFAAELSPAYRVVPLSTSDIQLNNVVLEAVAEMFEAAKEKGYKDFFVNSGYRSYQKQRELYNSSKDKSFVQLPGASEHQTGYAIDIAYNGLTGEAFGDSPQGKWLMKNAHKYGFILRYPEDKTEITKISYEPWHYRYVGIPHAYYCYDNNLCLEEYVNFLAMGGSYSLSIDKTVYTVYYATENDGFIDVPADKTCQVSSDNMGGYAVVIMG